MGHGPDQAAHDLPDGEINLTLELPYLTLHHLSSPDPSSDDPQNMSKLTPMVSSGILRPIGNQVTSKDAALFSLLGVLGGLPGVFLQFQAEQVRRGTV